ncbi:MAG: AzlD domain-containing protein [Clostridia bacterium]|nr:AzlD domain-containing protein [Clostridia bacterium]MBR0536680.1 AzlD domain-containing protein [Clostridia bacterium]
MSDLIYPLSAIGVIALVTWGLRAFPFLLFAKRPLPKTIRYLGKVLPPAIMTVLVVYCLKDTDFSQTPFGVPELLSGALVVILQTIKKNMYLSIIAGTVCYMVLIRVL